MAEPGTRAFAPGRSTLGCLGSLVVAALVLALGIRVLLPWALRHLAVRQAELALHARVQLANVDLSVLGGEVALEGLRIAPADAPEQARLAADRILLRIDRAALYRGRLGLGSLSLERPELLLDRTGEGALSLGLGGFAGAEPPPEAEPASPASPFVISRLVAGDARIRVRPPDADTAGTGTQIEIGALQLDDLALGGAPGPGWRIGAVEVEDLRLRLPGAGEDAPDITGRLRVTPLDPGAVDPGALELELRRGEARVGGRGELGLRTGRVALDLEWQDLDVPALLETLSLDLSESLDLRSGTIAGEARLELQPAQPAGEEGDESHPDRLLLRGSLSARAVDVRLPDRAAASWTLLELDVEEALVPLATDGATPELRLARARWESPSLRWILAPAAEEAQPAAAAGPAPVRVVVAALEIDDGLVTLVDREAGGVEIGLTDLRLRAEDVRLPSLRAERLEMTAAGPGGAPLRVAGRLASAGGELSIAGDEIDLLALAPGLAARSDFVLERGRASFETDVELEGSRYVAPTRLVLHDLRLDTDDAGRSFRQQFGMPPALALALLRDARGDIELTLPVEGSRDGTRIRIWPVLRRALSDALVNALSKPLALLGSVVVNDGRIADFDLAPVRFVPGGVEIATAGEEQVERAAELLAEHPELRLELVSLVASPDARALAAAGGGAAAPETLRTLAADRAAAVRDALLAANVSGDRVATREGPLALGAGPPRVELVLEAGAADVSAPAGP